jgi:hypothetical protein
VGGWVGGVIGFHVDRACLRMRVWLPWDLVVALHMVRASGLSWTRHSAFMQVGF